MRSKAKGWMNGMYSNEEVQWDSDIMGRVVFIYGSVVCVVYGAKSNIMAVTVAQGTESLLSLELFLV